MADNIKSKKTWTLDRILPWILLIGGTIAVIASLLLTIEVFNRLENPSYVPVCNLNPVLSCTSVADSNQSHLFGFPNYFLGLASYAALATIGAVLLAGAKFKRWFWLATEVGMLFAISFIAWLQFESLYRIGALCIFCVVVWAVTIPMFWYLTLFNFRNGHIKTPKKLRFVIAFAQKHHADILVLWFLIIIGLILKRFWYYWNTLL